MIALLALLTPPAAAVTPVEAAQQAELDRLRGQVAGEVQLGAYDLLDELVVGWREDPPFAEPTPMVLASVTVPVGLGTGMEALLENHLAALLTANPTTNVQLVHCPSCTAVVVHSGPEATVLTRGIDDPSVLAEVAGGGGKVALFVDVEAEGTSLVLRARLTRLTPDLPILWSRTIASSTASPAMLRQPNGLTTAAEARAEYLAALHDRGPISVPVRFGVRTYAQPDGNGGVAPPPFLWIQTGVEVGVTDARAWTGSLVAGYSFIPQAYQGLLAQARVSRLVTGRARSYTHPDLYLFFGGAVMTVWGQATYPFQQEKLTSDDIITALSGDDPRFSFGAIQLGADLRLGNRLGTSFFLETMPSLRNSGNLGDYIRPLGVGFQGMGAEVTFWL